MQGQLTPVFFGSAINNFGVQTFLENFLQLAPKPEPRRSTEGVVEPTDEKFSGYVFKIQANMNPAHRDRIAFLRIVSGKFERGMSVKHVRVGKEIKLAQPQQFWRRIEILCRRHTLAILSVCLTRHFPDWGLTQSRS